MPQFVYIVKYVPCYDDTPTGRAYAREIVATTDDRQSDEQLHNMVMNHAYQNHNGSDIVVLDITCYRLVEDHRPKWRP